MRQREMMNLVGGLIVGFIIGALVIGAADVDLFGTAANEDDNGNDVVEVEREYYLVTIDELGQWLGDEEDADGNTLLNMDELTASSDFQQYFASADELDDATTNLLSNVHDRLGGDDDENLGVCLALNNDPYSASGPLLYVYLQVPLDLVDDVPEELKTNPTDPKEVEDSLVWSTRCYEPEAENES